ncbi:ubiquitin carboxyl-terminal hydrolase 8 [Entomortierella parvispora]|uniref:ubiquitinyl hydrolase 1 n=1 Tax=Entomortierella parvispora TaxID=205924 RepID=A0A9P3H2F4_9FUNG|nr:ubiquitin carboxyl-terminal hydrolase 8 [Entomortierella parvispora]
MMPIHSSPSTSNVLDSPAKKIKDLVDRARVQLDPSYSFKNYVSSANTLLNSADLARVRGDMEGAFVQYLKATAIVLEVVKETKDYEKHKTDSGYLALKKRIMGLFSDTEKIKDLLKAKYEQIQEIEAAALATAARPGRPKPPPKPSKPDFLSARHDGQTNNTTTTTATTDFATSISAPILLPTSSFSAPATPPTGYLTSVPSSSPSLSSESITAMQGSMSSLSLSSNGSSPHLPPPSSLPSYRPLQPTIYGSPQTSSVPSKQQQMVTSYGNLGSVPTSTAFSGQYSGSPIPVTSAPGSFSNAQNPASPVPAPRPVASLPPPTSAPAAVTNSKPIYTTSTPSGEEYKHPLSIKPQRLLQYMTQPNGPPDLLLLDVRTQLQCRSAKIKYRKVVNIEPVALREGVTAKSIAEQGLFNNPPQEREWFSARASSQLVIYYDQDSTEMNTPALINLVRALHDLEFERPLQKRPVLLVGGFFAWLECAGMKWVEGYDVDAALQLDVAPTSTATPTLASSTTSTMTSGYSDPTRPASTPIPGDHEPHNHAIFTKVAQGGGINRRDGRLISRSIGEYISSSDGPQSMINPKLGAGLSKMAYPPQATPYSNLNASSYPPAQNMYSSSSVNSALAATNGSGSYPPNAPGQYGRMDDHRTSDGFTMVGGNLSNQDSSRLQRRLTVYDDHWRNFGAAEKPQSPTVTSPPIPDKIPLPGSSMSSAASGKIVSSGPSYNSNHNGEMVPASYSDYHMRPDIPAKPMRPLPQPPGMNDLRNYTQFGSGFSKIGSSQLGKTGLTNLGNTCYMNSVIQCLISTPPLTRFFMDGSFKRYINMRNSLGTQGRLAEAFSELIRSMWSGQSLVISPTSFRYAIAGFAPQFKGTEQHDSQEFLSFLLDGLHEDLKSEPQRPPPGEQPEGSAADDAMMESLPDYEASNIAWQRYLRRENSIIVSLFQGQFRNQLRCTKCNKTSTTYNSFMYLALPIKAKSSGRQPQTLLGCLNNFVEQEVMEGDNAWHCPGCKKARKATKQMTLSRLPDVLLIQLKRFSSDGPFKNKIKAMVQYPMQDLDLTKYLPAPSKNARPEPAIYDLYAVSNHSGEVSSGHYTACVRGEAPNSWTNFDDTRVSPCDQSVAVSEHGYTLFYVRKK